MAAHVAGRLGTGVTIRLAPDGRPIVYEGGADHGVALPTVTAAKALPAELIGDSVVVCAGVLERLRDPRPVLELLRHWSASAPVTLISTTERDQTRGWADFGPPAHPGHVREWTLSELARLLRLWELPVEFLGLTRDGPDGPKHTALVVCGRRDMVPRPSTPGTFRVLAVIPAYNEEDVIGHTVGSLLDAGIEVHVINHGSTDRTLERTRMLTGRGRLSWETWPTPAPAGPVRWAALLDRVDEVAARSGADWCLFHGADERRSGPWDGLTLRDALYRVQADGFNAVDHTILQFRPIDHHGSGGDPVDHFRHFTFGDVRGPSVRVSTWRNQRRPVGLADSAGRDVRFPGRRVHPFNFLVRHYPIRSGSQGERKLRDRHARRDPLEGARHWPPRDDHRDRRGQLIWERDAVVEFDASFMARHLAERLCGDIRGLQSPAGDEERA